MSLECRAKSLRKIGQADGMRTETELEHVHVSVRWTVSGGMLPQMLTSS